MGKQQNIPSSFSETEQAFLNELSGASNKPVATATAKPSAATTPTPIEPKPTIQPSNKGGEEYSWGKSFSNSIVDLVIAPQTALNMGKTITGQFLSNLFGLEDAAKEFADMGEKRQRFIDKVADTYKFDTPEAKRSAINRIDLKTEPISQVYQQALKEADKTSIIPAQLKAGIQAAPEAAKQAYKAVVGALYDPETDIVETLQDLSIQVAPMLIPMGIGKWGSAGKAVKAAAGAYNTALTAGASAAEIAELSTGLTKAVSAAKKTGQLSSFVVGTLQAIPSALEDARKAGLSNEQIPAFVLASSTGQTLMDALVPTIGEFGKGVNKEVAKVTADQLTKESFSQLSNIVSESDFFKRSLELGISKGIGNKLGQVAKKAGSSLLKTGVEGIKEGLNEGIMSEGIGNIGVQQLFNAYNDARGRNLQVGKGNFAPFSQAGNQLLGATIAGAFSGTALTTSSAVLGSVGNKPFRSLWNTGQYIPTAYAVLEDAYVRSAALPENQRAEAFNQNVEAVKSGLEKNFASGVLNDQQYQQGLSAIDGMAKSISGFGYNTPASNYAKYNHYLYTQVNIPQAIGSVVQGLGLDGTSGIPPEAIASIQQNIASTLQTHAYDASISPFSKADLTAIIESTPNLSPEQRSTLRVKYANLDEGLQQSMRQHNFNRLVLGSLEATGQVDENAISEGNKAIKNWKVGAEFNAPVGDTGLEYESQTRKVANISDDGQILIDQNGDEFDAKLVRFATKPEEEVVAETPVEEPKAESTTNEPTLTKAQQADANLQPFDGNVKSGALYRFKQTSPIYEADDKGKNKLDFQGNPIQAKLSDGTPRVKVEDGYATFEQDPSNPDNYEVTVTSETKASEGKMNTKRQTISVPKAGFDPTTKSFKVGEASLDILGEAPSQVPEMAEAPVKPVKGKKAEPPTYKVVNREYDNQLTQVKDLTEENFQEKLPIGTLIPFTDNKGNASWYQVTSHGVNRSTDESTAVVMPVVIKQSGEETKIQRLSNAELSAKGITGLSSIPISLLGGAKILSPEVFVPKQEETKTEENEQSKAKEDSTKEATKLDVPSNKVQPKKLANVQPDANHDGSDLGQLDNNNKQSLDTLVGKPVLYKGNKGSIIYDETDGYIFQYEKGNREIILGKENIIPKEIQEVVPKQNPLKRQVNVTSDKSVTIDGKQYEIVTNENGSAVGLKSDSGTITNEATLIAVEVQRNNFDPEIVNERINEALEQAGEDPVTVAAIDNIFNNNITERVENLLANGPDENTTDADYLQAELFVEAVSKELDRFPDSDYAKAMKESLQQFQKDLDETADKYTKEPTTEQPEPTVEAESDVITGNAPQEQITEASTADKVVAGLKTLKIDTKNKAFDAVLGIPVAAWNASVDTVIALVRAGQSLQQAINQQYNFLKNTYNPQLDKDAYEAEIRRGQNAKRPVTTPQTSPVVPTPDTTNPAYSANPTDNKFSYDPIESNNTYDSIGVGYNQEATDALVDNNETRIKEAAANREAVKNGFELLEKDARTRFGDGVITKQQLTDIIKDLDARKAIELEKYTDVANKVRIEAANRLIAPNGLIDAKPELVQKDIYSNYQTLMSTAAGTYLGKLLSKAGLGLPNLISKEAAVNSAEAGIGHFNWNALLATMMRKGSTLHNVFVESKNGWDNLSATAKNELSYFEEQAMSHPEISKWSLLNNGTKEVTRSNIAEYAGGTISVAETFTDKSGNSFANDEYSDTDKLEVPKAVLVSIAMSMRTDKETQGSYNLNTHIKKEVGGGIVPIQFADQEQAETFVDNVFADKDVQDFDQMRQDFFAKAYPLINEVYKKTRGVNLPDLGEQYWPLIKSASTVNASGDEKTSTPFFGIKALHKDPGIIKSRTRDKFSTIVAGDALATMNGYGREIVDFIAVEPLVHNFNALYNQNKGFFEGKQQIKGTMIGKGAGYGLVMSQLRSLTQKWVNPEKQRGSDFMNELMKSFQTSVLAANQGTVFVQSGAAVSTLNNGMIEDKYIKSSIIDTMFPLFANAFLGSKNIPQALKKMGFTNSDERWGIYQKKLNSLHKELEGLKNGQAIVNRIDNAPTRILTDNIIRSASDKDLILTGKKIQSPFGKIASGVPQGFGLRDFFSTHFFGQMQLADSSVILMLYEAGKKQVAAMSKEQGKNLTDKQIQEEAAVLATRVMYDTQQTFDTTDKSNIQNNNHSAAKYITVFATQPYKNLSRAYEMQYNAALDPKNNYLKKIANGYARNYFILNQAYNIAIKTLYGALATATAAAALKGVGADELAEEELNKFRDNMGNVPLTMYSVLSQIVPVVGVTADLLLSMRKDAEAGIEIPAMQGVGKIVNSTAVLGKDADNYAQAKNNQYQGTKLLIDGASKVTGVPSIFTKTLDNAVLKPLLKPVRGVESDEAKEKKDSKKTSALGATFREVMGTQTPAEIKSKRNFEKAQRKAQKTYEQ